MVLRDFLKLYSNTNDYLNIKLNIFKYDFFENINDIISRDYTVKEILLSDLQYCEVLRFAFINNKLNINIKSYIYR